MKRLIVLLGACIAGGCGTDPEIQRSRKALRAWDEAERAEAAPTRTLALEEALAHDPASLALRRSLARELGSAGAYAEAVSTLDAVIPDPPTTAHKLVLWDRAALHARAGDLEPAARDVALCIQLGVDPRALAADPAFGVLMAHQDTAHLLPKPTVRVDGPPPPEKVLAGESWRRTVRIAAPGQAVRLAPVAPFPPGLVLAEVVEDILSTDAYHSARELRFEWRPEVPGSLHIPAVAVTVGDQSAALAPVSLEVVQLGGASSSTEAARVDPGLLLPSDFDDGALDPSSATPANGGQIVQAPAHLSCSLSPTPKGAVRLVRREGGQPRWQGWWVPPGGEVVFSCPGEAVSVVLR